MYHQMCWETGSLPSGRAITKQVSQHWSQLYLKICREFKITTVRNPWKTICYVHFTCNDLCKLRRFQSVCTDRTSQMRNVVLQLFSETGVFHSGQDELLEHPHQGLEVADQSQDVRRDQITFKKGLKENTSHCH